jgi:hypothetical protein
MYDRIEVELKGVQRALQSIHVVSTEPPPSEELELGDEPTQLCKLVDVTEPHLRQAKDEKDQATTALKQAQEEMVEKRWVTQKEKDDLQAKFEEDRAHVKQEKEKFLTEQLGVKEVVDRALRSVTGLEPKVEDQVEHQVA